MLQWRKSNKIMTRDIWEMARGQSGFKACLRCPEKGGKFGEHGAGVIWDQCTQGSECQAKGLRGHSGAIKN